MHVSVTCGCAFFCTCSVCMQTQMRAGAARMLTCDLVEGVSRIDACMYLHKYVVIRALYFKYQWDSFGH